MKTWTLASIDGVDPDQTARTIEHCAILMHDIRPFDRILLFSFKQPEQFSHEYIQIPKLDFKGYNFWSVRELGRHIATDFVLTIHPDGYILNPEKWDEGFMEYDYIGAPWPLWAIGEPEGKAFRVGNSGFCLRSKKFCHETATSMIPYMMEPDDYFFCRKHRFPVRYAPPEIAARFSLETDDSWGFGVDDVFGFHRIDNLPFSRRKLLTRSFL